MTFRRVLNIFTLAIVAILLFTLRHELVQAWELLGTVDLWILALIIPLQFLSYYASGAAMFSYLSQRGYMQNVRRIDMARMALGLNYVNHILPTAGVSGVSYMTWRLSKMGINSGRAALAQVVRFVASFGSFVVLLVLATVIVTLDTGVNRIVILATSALTSGIIMSGMVIWYVIDNERRLTRFSDIVASAVNWFGRKVIRAKRPILAAKRIKLFMDDLQEDYRALRANPRLLIRPFGWGVVFNLTEVSLFFFTFLALGSFVNPATILLAIGIAAVVGTVLITPGGTGGYEAAMVLVLASSGVEGAVVLAGVLLARVILILLTIVSGYVFYHRALTTYGKPAT